MYNYSVICHLENHLLTSLMYLVLLVISLVLGVLFKTKIPYILRP